MSDTTITVRFSFTRAERQAIGAAIDGTPGAPIGRGCLLPEATPAELLAWCSLIVRAAMLELAPDEPA